MIFSKSGKIIDDFYSLGHPAVPIYLLDGTHPVIFDAGITLLADLYIEQIEQILGIRKPAYCCLTHVHFDHCGAVAAFKKRFPRMRVVASRKAAAILERPNAIEAIRRLNVAARELVKQIGLFSGAEARFGAFNIDYTAGEGERIDVAADCSVEVIASPGHTWDCLSYRVDGRGILLSSEAAGQPDRTGYIVIDCLADYDRYLETFMRLKALAAEILCPGHIFVYSGGDVTAYFEKAQAACRLFRQTVETCAVEEEGMIDRIKERIKALEYDRNPGPKQPEPAYLINLEARIKAVLKAARP